MAHVSDFSIKLTWTEIVRNGEFFLKEECSIVSGFTEFGPMPRAWLEPVKLERKRFWEALHNERVEELLRFDRTVTNWPLPLYPRVVAGDEAASKSESPDETAGLTPEPVAKRGPEPRFHPCSCGIIRGECTC